MAILAIHGHFYQPDRRDPRTGLVPSDPSAAPAHDWNARIADECYGPNAELGNFARIGFDAGPTLLTWLRSERPGLHESIVSQGRGGNAMAQGWHHAILPLASARDRRTEIRWGLRDFELRSGVRPDGLWLPEAAVDLATLRTAADEGVRYVILAPWQAAGPIDPRQPYQVELGDGRSIMAVFYEAGLSADISFRDDASANAGRFLADYVLPRSGYLWDGSEPIILVASDGELYGHHKVFRDLFLAALPAAASQVGVRFTSLGAALRERHIETLPRIAIRDGSSWSCHHGSSGRWSADCGCTPNGAWKAPLRAALDALAARYDMATDPLLEALDLDPISVRDEYVSVAAGFESGREFVARAMAKTKRCAPEQAKLVTDVLVGARSRLAMFTSCAWFWEEPSRSETMAVLRYAGHAAGIARRLTGANLERGLCADLARFTSPLTGEDGSQLYARAMGQRETVAHAA
jgi:hypothetical protein